MAVLVTRHTLVWTGILVAGFFCQVTDIPAMVAPIGVTFCMMVLDISPLLGRYALGPPSQNSDHKFLENGKSQGYMTIITA